MLHLEIQEYITRSRFSVAALSYYMQICLLRLRATSCRDSFASKVYFSLKSWNRFLFAWDLLCVINHIVTSNRKTSDMLSCVSNNFNAWRLRFFLHLYTFYGNCVVWWYTWISLYVSLHSCKFIMRCNAPQQALSEAATMYLYFSGLQPSNNYLPVHFSTYKLSKSCNCAHLFGLILLDLLYYIIHKCIHSIFS